MGPIFLLFFLLILFFCVLLWFSWFLFTFSRQFLNILEISQKSKKWPENPKNKNRKNGKFPYMVVSLCVFSCPELRDNVDGGWFGSPLGQGLDGANKGCKCLPAVCTGICRVFRVFFLDFLEISWIFEKFPRCSKIALKMLSKSMKIKEN